MKSKFILPTAAAIAIGASLVGCTGGTIQAEETDSASSASYSSSKTASNSNTEKSSGYEQDNDYDTYSYSSNGTTYETTKSNDGSSLTLGSDGYTEYKHSDGTGMATDGKGNFVSDTDGDGEVDRYSIDGGTTWDKL